MIAAKLIRVAALPIISTLVLAACGVGGSSASSSSPARSSPAAPASKPQASPIASPAPSQPAGSFGVLATRPLPGEAIQITVVGLDGRIAAATTAQVRTAFKCVKEFEGPILPVATVSASDRRLYYLDGDTTVRFLAPDGSKGEATRVPGGGQVGSTFAVSPDDRRIAVVTTDYSRNPPTFRIYVEDIPGGTNHVEIFSGSGAQGVPWALGWRAGQIILGYAGGCTQGGGPFSSFPFEYHLVDAATAVRSATLGSLGGCRAVSLPAAAGILCSDQAGQIQVVGWDGRNQRQFAAGDAQYFNYSLAPSGRFIAACCEINGATTVMGVNPPAFHAAGSGSGSGFIDEQHLLIGAPARQSQARIFVLAGDGTTIPVAATGDFVARLPGSLDAGPGN